MVSRTQKSAKNGIVGIAFAIISSLLSFLLNAVFIRLLGLEYAGINSLFTSILNILNIADLGICNAILFRLYKKIQDRDDDGICLMLTVYKRICYFVAGVILISGLCCLPFLDELIKDKPSFPEPLWILFLIVLSTSIVTHIFDYTRQILIANQDQYLSTIINYVFKYAISGFQLLVLLLYKDIYLYLLVSLVISVIKFSVYAFISHRKYNAHWNSKLHLSKEQRTDLLKDTGSLAIFKFCRTLDASIDTLLISKYVAIATTAVYGSVCIIITFLEECFGNINDGMLASIGNLNASGNKENVSNVFYQSMHFTFLVFGVITVTSVPILSPLVKWWIGYTLDDMCMYLILINFYFGIFGNQVAVFRNSMGIFVKGWKRPLFTALLNIIFSLFLVIKIGLLGTLLGTTIARILTLHWYDPLLVCREGFNEKPWKYYRRFLVYLAITLSFSIFMLYLESLLPVIKGILDIILHTIFFAFCNLLLFVIIGFCFPEQRPLFKRFYYLIKR